MLRTDLTITTCIHFLTCAECFVLLVICQRLLANFASCDIGKERLVQMTIITVESILASKLYNIANTGDSIFVCSSICTSEELCYYMTVDKDKKMCELYSQGLISYNVTQHTTFVVQTRIHKVSEENQ